MTHFSVALCIVTHPHSPYLERFDTASLMMLHSVTSPNSSKNSCRFSINQRIKVNTPWLFGLGDGIHFPEIWPPAIDCMQATPLKVKPLMNTNLMLESNSSRWKASMQGISSVASPSDVCQLKPPTNILLGGSGEERVRRRGEREGDKWKEGWYCTNNKNK